ncbi:MAG TPA: sugar ABC transporter permease [Candidatus Dormibacteraeota bacterium]|nr:sugar ABC transporter permease [Candidatus Dormibacteraeota bacterium]
MTVQPRELGAPLVVKPKVAGEPTALARGWGFLSRAAVPVLVHAFLIVMVIFALFPAFFVVQAAFRPGQSLYTLTLSLWPDHPTWDNFTYIWTQIPFPTWLRNSLGVGVGTMLSGLVGSATGAYALARFRFTGKRMTLILLLAIQAFPTVLALVPIYLILKTIGLIGSPFGLMLAYVASALVFATWNLKGYFDTIPRELDEAALIDGCTVTQAFIRIILPLSLPALAVTALLMFLTAWNEWVMAQTLLLNEDSYTVPVGLWGLQNNYRIPWGYFAAASCIVSVPVVVLFLALQQYFRAGLTVGSVKG